MGESLIWQIGLALLSAGAVYGGIRSDLKAMHEKISSAKESAGEAHKRLDSILLNQKGGCHG